MQQTTDVDAAVAAYLRQKESDPLSLYIPYPKQEQFHRSAAHKTLFIAGNRSGKALAVDTPIPTPDGWKTMMDLSVGDVVFDESGHRCNVTMATDVMYGHDCYKVLFSDGSWIVADSGHLWVVHTRRLRKNLSRRVKNLTRFWVPQRYSTVLRKTSDMIALLYDRGVVNYSIPVCGALELPEQELVIHPYVLGAWLGDGSSGSAQITCSNIDNSIIERISALGVKVKRGLRYDLFSAGIYSLNGRECDVRDVKTGRFISSGSMHSALKSLGILGNKHIPALYLRSSKEQRLELLRGLMDTDGCCGVNGSCEYTTINKVLADGFVELVRSLGVKARITVGDAKLNGRFISKKYRVHFTPYFPAFYLERKAQRQSKRGKYSERALHRFIVSIDPVVSVPVKCIAVDGPSHQYLAGNSMIPTHNSLSGAHEAAMAVTGRHFVDGKYPIPNRGRIAGERTTLEGEIIPLLHRLLDRYLVERPRRNSVGMEYQWKFRNGSFFDILTYSQDDKQWTGVALDWAWFDEPFRESLYDEMVSRMSKGRGGYMFFTMTPLFHAAWMFERLVRGVEEEGKVSPTGVMIITASIWDNCIDNGGYLEREAIEKMVAEYDEEMLEARVNGKFAVMRDIVFPTYDPAYHVLDPEVTPQQVRDEEMQLYVALDPHKVRPPAWGLYAIDKNDVRYTLDEWPNYFEGHYKGKYYNELKSSRFTYRDLVQIWWEIEQRWGGNIRHRFIDPRYGKALQDNSRLTTMEEFARAAKELGYEMKFRQAVVGKDMGVGEIDSGLHLINTLLAHTPNTPHRPKWFDNVRCANHIRAMQYLRVRRREGKEAEGRSPSEELLDEYKDFADLKRYFAKSVGGYKHFINRPSDYVYRPASSVTGY